VTWKVPEQFRKPNAGPGYVSRLGDPFGVFECKSPLKNPIAWNLMILATGGLGWFHVSVHAWLQVGKRFRQRTPLWEEMCFVKGLFWDDEDVVMQLHPRRSEYVNLHAHTLHLWQPQHQEIPTPPKILVG
jgi:hypothetical protein